MNGAFLRRRDQTVRSLRVEHYSSAVNILAAVKRFCLRVDENLCREL